MSRKAVNAPITPEFRDRDVNQKLQLYGIYSAFANGKVPTNKQIDIALSSLLRSKSLGSPPEDLSSESREIIEDVKEVIASARNLILVKNEGNLIQEFIWDAENVSQPSSIRQPVAGIDKDTERQRGAQAAEDLKTLGTLLITNGQFRKLLSDAMVLLRDMASDEAQKAANFVRPSEDQLAHIDEPAEEGVWHEKPDMSKGAMKSQVQSMQKKGQATDTNRDAGETPLVSQPVGDAYGRSTEAGDGEPNRMADGNTRFSQTGVNGARKAKTKSWQLSDKTKGFLSEKMPPERQDQTMWRVKKMIVEIQGHSDYQRAIDSLLSLAETYARRWSETARQGSGQMKNARDESGTKGLESKLRVLIERFANCTSTADLFESLQKIARDANKDERLKSWFRSMNTYIRKCLREQGYVLQDNATEEWQRLHSEGRYLFRDRYRNDANQVIGELKFMGDQFNEDPMNRAFGQSLQKLFHDLGYDESGNLAFKKHAASDFTSIILPAILENLHYVPVPRIEVCDPMVDVVIENLAIECDNLLPNVVEFSSDNYWRWGRKKIGNKKDNKVMVSATGMQTDWKDVSYYVRKKKGFPHLTDTGVMDVFLGGEGFSFRIIGSSSRDQETRRFIRPEQVSVSIKHLDIRLKKSKHKLLFGLSKPLLLSVLRPAVQKALETQIRDYFNKADEFAYEVDKEARRTRELARNDPEDLRNMYSHYLDAVRKRFMETKQQRQQKAEATKAKAETPTQTHLAMDKYDSIFKDIKLPGGISSKASEYRDLADKGDRWESPVFSIGTAKETTGLPRLATISRKSHTTTTQSEQSGAPREPMYHQVDGYPPRAGAAGGLADGPVIVDGPGHKAAVNGGAHGANVDGSHTILGTPCPV